MCQYKTDEVKFLFSLCVISVRSGSHVSVKSDQSKHGDMPNFSEKKHLSKGIYYL